MKLYKSKLLHVLFVLFILAGIIVQARTIPDSVTAQTLDSTAPTMDIKFNPTGTHFDTDGQLLIRLDFYPTEDSKSYASQHVEVPIIPEEGYTGKVDEEGIPVDQADYDKWFSSLPTEWVTNPALCVFVKVPPDITETELEQYIYDTYTADVTATIDDIMSKTGEHEASHLISPCMRDKTTLEVSKTTLSVEDKADVVSLINSTIATDIKAGDTSGTVEEVKPQSIAVGQSASDRSGYTYLTRLGYSWHTLAFNSAALASADGSLDTVEVWLVSSATGSTQTAGTYNPDGTYHDGESLGHLSFGSKQTVTGLTIAIANGEGIAISSAPDGKSTQIESDFSGGLGTKYEMTEVGNNISGSWDGTYADGAYSLYGTGAESGGTPYTCGISDFLITYVSDTQMDLSWNYSYDGDQIMIRAQYGEYPDDIPDSVTTPSDGYLVYYGNGTSVSDTSMNFDQNFGPIYYKAWAQRADLTWHTDFASGWKESQKLLLIVLIMLAMGLLTLAFIFKVPALFLASAAMWVVDAAYFITVQSVSSWDLYYDVGLLCIGVAFICLIEMLVTGLSKPDKEEPEEEDTVTKQEKQWEKANAALRMPRFRRTRRW